MIDEQNTNIAMELANHIEKLNRENGTGSTDNPLLTMGQDSNDQQNNEMRVPFPSFAELNFPAQTQAVITTTEEMSQNVFLYLPQYSLPSLVAMTENCSSPLLTSLLSKEELQPPYKRRLFFGPDPPQSRKRRISTTDAGSTMTNGQEKIVPKCAPEVITIDDDDDNDTVEDWGPKTGSQNEPQQQQRMQPASIAMQGKSGIYCPRCGWHDDDGSPMVCCDGCDDWYHYPCVGILNRLAATETWFCTKCSNQINKAINMDQ